MLIKRVTTEGLAHHSYFVAQGGEAIVIDPRRDIDAYLRLAEESQSEITHILETHRNEDYAIGSCELAARTDATVFHGKALPFQYGSPIEDGHELGIGRLRLRAIETPGHTAESMSYALVDSASGDDPVMVFTGDALFVGEVGRTDLYGGDRRRELAGWLYDSIVKRLLPLGDGVIIAPCHGGGSVCGGNISDRHESTIGYERRHNPRLTVADRERFIHVKAQERFAIPSYFKRMEAYNLQGPPVLGHLPRPRPMSVHAFEEAMTCGATVLDVRMPQAFASGHIPGSYNVWLGGVPVYAGWVLPTDRPLLIVGDADTPIEQVVRYLIRVGYERMIGYLRGGFEPWQNAAKPLERTSIVTAPEARALLAKGALFLDVRNVDEWSQGVVPDSMLIDTAELERRIGELPKDRPIVTMCSVGHRGSIGASILQRHGIERVHNFLGGFEAWRQMGYPVAPGPDAATISAITWATDTAPVGEEAELTRPAKPQE